MTKTEATIFLAEVKKTHLAILRCINEAKTKGWGDEILKKWNDFLNDFSIHEKSIEKLAISASHHENIALNDIIWFRSIARKLDYFNVDQLDSGVELSSCVDALFVSTL